jgi:hypothetical protein
LSAYPVAKHPPVAATHAALRSVLPVAPDGVWAGSTVQLVPFHASTRAVGAVELDVPTAVQAVEDRHETLDKRLEVAPLGLGVD